MNKPGTRETTFAWNVEFGGQSYAWEWRPGATGRGVWHWTGPNFTKPPAGTEHKLNRLFFKSHAKHMVDTLELFHNELFKLFREMNATDAEIEGAGLSKLLFQQKPELARQRRFQQLPAAGHTPFNCSILLDWYVGSQESAAVIPHVVNVRGNGPFEEHDFVQFLKHRGIRTVDDALPEDTDVVIIGRQDWEPDEIDFLIEERVGLPLRIFSQEMFLALLLNKTDPFRGGLNVLEAFKAGHPGLKFVSQGWVGWVCCWVRSDRSGLSGNGSTQIFGGLKSVGILSFMGYRVGQNGEEVETRRDILKAAFTGDIPLILPPEEMKEWGAPGTADRLRKIANCLASFCRNNAAKSNHSSAAIADWTADLGWLKETYYRGSMRFHWPDTAVH